MIWYEQLRTLRVVTAEGKSSYTVCQFKFKCICHDLQEVEIKIHIVGEGSMKMFKCVLDAVLMIVIGVLYT